MKQKTKQKKQIAIQRAKEVEKEKSEWKEINQEPRNKAKQQEGTNRYRKSERKKQIKM